MHGRITIFPLAEMKKVPQAQPKNFFEASVIMHDNLLNSLPWYSLREALEEEERLGEKIASAKRKREQLGSQVSAKGTLPTKTSETKGEKFKKTSTASSKSKKKTNKKKN